MVTVRAAVEAAGFTGSAAQTMTGIVIAESGGNAWAYNPNRLTGDKSYGLAQINMIDSLGPARRQQYGLSSNDSLFDPTVNLGVAWIMSNHGTYWMDWSTYKRGEHLSHVNDVSTQITQTPRMARPIQTLLGLIRQPMRLYGLSLASGLATLANLLPILPPVQ